MNIAEQITLLIDLQKLDGEIYKHNSIKAQGPGLIKELDDELKEKGKALQEEEDALKKLLVDQKTKETELGSKEEVIKKCTSQLYQLKTNKEYTAMQQEIKGHEADKSVLEDGIITVMDEVEAKRRSIVTHKAALGEEEKKINVRKGDVNKRIKEAEDKLGSLNSQRSEMATKIDKEMLRKYDRILEGKEGMAMVPVRHDACGGCNLNLPPQVINLIKMKRELIFCESCSRILYINDGA